MTNIQNFVAADGPEVAVPVNLRHVLDLVYELAALSQILELVQEGGRFSDAKVVL